MKLLNCQKNMKISDRIIDRNNNFDFLRFVAASLVIFSHSFVLLNGISWDPYISISGYEGFGSLAVNIFFVISGFLITKSWFDNSKWHEFIKKRVLRIFPALFAVVFLTTFILGPLVTSLTFSEYFSNSGTYDYLRNAILQIRFFLPGVFSDNPFPGGVNGSLWTLPIEFILYFGVLIYGMFRLFKFKILIIFLYIVLIGMYCANRSGVYFLDMDLQTLNIIRLAAYFVGGSMFYIYREKINLNSLLFLFLLATLVVTFNTKIGLPISFLVWPYIIFFLSFYKNNIFENFAAKGDYSYGLYIYAFPVQATIAHFFAEELNTPFFFLFSFIITYIFAGLSWHLVEKQFLKMKSKSIKELIGINFLTKLINFMIITKFKYACKYLDHK